MHPLVRTHPETGRKGLFISNAVSTGIKDIFDLAPDASQSLIDELFAHTDDPRFQVRHKWQVGDLVIWDNRTLMHKATTDILPPDKFELSTDQYDGDGAILRCSLAPRQAHASTRGHWAKHVP